MCLLALSDRGAPSYDQGHAAAFAALGIPSFACTPDLFPDLMAAAIHRRDLNRWGGAARYCGGPWVSLFQPPKTLQDSLMSMR